MSFDTILRSILEECGGGLGAALMSSDGMPVDQVQVDGASRVLGDDIATAGAEFGRILSEARKASDTLGGGAVEESVVCLSRFTIICRSVDEELFVVLAISPDGNLGKARYLIRRNLLAIRQEL